MVSGALCVLVFLPISGLCRLGKKKKSRFCRGRIFFKRGHFQKKFNISGAAGAFAPPGAGSESSAGAKAPPGAGSEFLAGAFAPPGAGPKKISRGEAPPGAGSES